MRRILLAAILAASAVLYAAPEPLPENQPATIEFVHLRDQPGIFYRVFILNGTNFSMHQTIGTNDFEVIGETNGESIVRFTLTGLPRGTNTFFFTASLSSYTNFNSDRSTNWNVEFLKKLSPPQGIRKP